MLDPGALASGLLTGLREGVEAALIVGILCAYLARTGGTRHFPKVWAGTTAAAVVSVVVGVVLFVTVGALPEPYEQVFEGSAMLLAAAVVTWMLFWMRRQAAGVRGQLQRAIDRVLSDGTAWGLALLAFTAVIREGLETSLFLAGQARAATAAGDAGAASVLAGAFAGLAIAGAIGFAIYRGSRALDIARFFRWTGVLLVFIAAGLLSHAVHELVEIGWIGLGTQTAFDVSAVLPDDAAIGLFLRALFGYTSSPEIVTLAAWATYVIVVLALYLRPPAPRPISAQPGEPGAARA